MIMNKNRNVLILGATGMAGHTIALYFIEQGYNVSTYSKQSFPYCENNIIGDALETDKFKAMLLHKKFDLVINCIALLIQDSDRHPSKAVYINSYLPHLIADTYKNTCTKVIHMSTDSVFAGNNGPYTEKSLQNGHTFYDRTKILGELDDCKNLTFRNSIIGPDMNENGIGLFNWFMKQNGHVNGYIKTIWSGVTTLTLAKAMEQAYNENLTGVFHLSNNDSISKFELLNLFNKYFRNKKLIITPSEQLQLDRLLVCTRSDDFSFKVPSYEQMIIEMKSWVDAHKEVYPFY